MSKRELVVLAAHGQRVHLVVQDHLGGHASIEVTCGTQGAHVLVEPDDDDFITSVEVRPR